MQENACARAQPFHPSAPPIHPSIHSFIQGPAFARETNKGEEREDDERCTRTHYEFLPWLLSCEVASNASRLALSWGSAESWRGIMFDHLDDLNFGKQRMYEHFGLKTHLSRPTHSQAQMPCRSAEERRGMQQWSAQFFTVAISAAAI